MRGRIRWAVAAVALLSVLAGGVTPANAVANGEPVPDGSYRFSVKLTMTGIPTADGGKRDSACSGALIAYLWIITAGHCFRDVNGVRVDRPVADLTTATVGRTDLTKTGGQVVEIVAVKQSATADVALAKLARPVRAVPPLRVGTQPPAVGTILRITGFGSLTSTNPVPSTRLMTGQLKVISVSTSELGLNGYAPQPNTTPCPYDSGAPYFTQKPGEGPVLVGVVSNGPGCPHTSVEIAGRTDNLAGWISSTIG
ncbi:S1 family peptidase [Actinoplanes siamensis]|uniref:Esterase n=1 Tax=Actinoplanes siamensis TaxID=1223317 RepID=A0A919TJ72_9ACTN|nr:trypsin-like serine protease [Actinoplanes siamensis]GIF04225.1 esterase [Actinoplanes siamensis]